VPDADADRGTLLDNFIDTGDYGVIEDFGRPERFILGRTGAGKTALITKLQAEHNNVIIIQPESLSLGYVSNSTIIKAMAELGVNFDLFFRLLWRHVLGVEILKYHFGINDQEANATIIARLKERFSKYNKRTNHARALSYLESWGSSFWQDTDYRIKELTSKVESKIESSVGVQMSPLLAGLKGGKKISNEEKTEVIHLAQEVVNSVQIKELADLIKMLDEAIDDKQKKYYLVIDKLDEKWVEDELRYKLIKALLETVKDFNAVEQVKPIVVLRNDLINRVYNLTRDVGFQEEKFSSLNLNIKWTKKQLIEMLDHRISYLVKKRYVKGGVTHIDILPKNINGVRAIDYMIDRTLMRPRDVINFFNFCIEEAVDSPIIEEAMVLKAEREYSRDRRSSILDEWYADYPSLDHWDILLKGLENEFFISDISLKQIEELCLTFNGDKKPLPDKIRELLDLVLDEKLTYAQLRQELVRIFYSVGYVGVNFSDHETPIWSYQPRKSLLTDEINDDSILCVHPCFWSCFNIKASKKT